MKLGRWFLMSAVLTLAAPLFAQSPRADCVTGVAALIAIVVLVLGSASCGGPDLVVPGTMVTATPAVTPTATPSS